MMEKEVEYMVINRSNSHLLETLVLSLLFEFFNLISSMVK